MGICIISVHRRKIIFLSQIMLLNFLMLMMIPTNYLTTKLLTVKYNKTKHSMIFSDCTITRIDSKNSNLKMTSVLHFYYLTDFSLHKQRSQQDGCVLLRDLTPSPGNMIDTYLKFSKHYRQLRTSENTLTVSALSSSSSFVSVSLCSLSLSCHEPTQL